MIAIIDSGGANITSVIAAFDRLGVKTVFTADAKIIQGADKVILPGVGAAGDAMRTLRASGLDKIIPALQQPVLGICLGMQLLFSTSEENNTDLLGVIDAPVKKFRDAPGKTVPHMGWNNVTPKGNHPLLYGLAKDNYFYFVHSYYAPDGEQTIGSCTYDETFSAIVARDNFFGCQFHPERSGPAGARILKNFVEMRD